MTDSKLQRASFCVICMAIVVYMVVSPALLWQLGIPYDAPGGSYAFKFHPGSYLLLIGCAVSLCAHGNPLVAAGRILMRNPALAAYLYATTFLLLYSSLRYGPSGSAYIIETLQMPAIIVAVLMTINDAQLRVLYRWQLALLVANAVIAIGESIAQHRLVPYTTGGVAIIEDTFRPTALLGHPLVNALITSSVLFTLLDTGRGALRYLLATLLMIGLLAFGGRTGFLVAAIMLFAYAGARLFAGLRVGRWSYLQLVGGAVGFFVCAASAIASIAITGVGERFFTHLYIDSSALYRVRGFDVLNYMNIEELLFGIAPADIRRIAARVFFAHPAIENFWLVMLMQFGAIGLSAFACALLGFGAWMFRRAGAGGRLAIVVFLVVASSNNSLSAKTCSMTVLFASLESVRAFRAFRVRGASTGGVRLESDHARSSQLDRA